MALLCPASEHFIHPMARRLQIGANARIGPAFGMQIDDGSPSLLAVVDLRVGRITRHRHTGFGEIRQDSLHGMVRWLTTKAQKTDPSNLMRGKTRVLSFQIDDQLAHLLWETASLIRRWGRRMSKQARHAFLLKPSGLVVQRAFTGSGFFGAFSRRLAKEDDGANFFIELLLRPKCLLLALLPVVGPFSAFPLARRHDDRLLVVFALP